VTPVAPRDSFRVAADEAGERLDKLVVKHARDLGRRGVSDLFRRGAVRIEGRAAKKGDRAREGEEVELVPEDAEVIRPEPGAPLDVRLETPDVVVVSKPAGQPTAPVRLGETGTLASALLGRYPELAGVGYRAREPGLLHRLDTQTSGLLVVTRREAVFVHLRDAMTRGLVDKRYLAVVEAAGLPESGVVDAPLAPDPADSRRVAIARGPGRPRAAVTRFRTLRAQGRFALVECEARHAYRHQVRVHLASIGHPIAGDVLYGGPEAPALGERHALHASYVAWAGDDVVPGFAVDDGLPATFAELVGAG
jgi:23S rRNA pseudouridine1911/1915/1917 synthase